MKEINMVTFTFDMGDGWMMDIASYDNGNTYWEAWIYHRNYGVKSLMFGCEKQKTCQDLDAFIEMAEVNFNDHKTLYEEEYMD